MTRKARARPRPVPGSMNKTEQRYLAEVLEPAVADGTYRSARFEALKLRLAAKTFYSPDFQVVNDETGEIELHEVKGFWEDDARVKIKVAAAQFPEFRFVAVQYKKGQWVREYF